MRLEASFRAALRRVLPGLPWHQAVAVATTVWLLFMAAFALAMSQVTGNGDALANARQVVVRVNGNTPTPVAAVVPQPSSNSTPAPADTTTTPTTDTTVPAVVDSGFLPSTPLSPTDTTPTDPGTTDPAATTEPVTWPPGQEAYTVLIGASKKEADAQGKLDEAIAVGIEAGMTPSLGFESLVTGWYVVFTGKYDTLAAAKKGADDLALRGYTDSTAVYLSEARVRRCEDGEQPPTPTPTTPSDPTAPTAPTTPAEPTPTTPAEPTPTTPAEPTPTTPAEPQPTGRAAQDEAPPPPAFADLEKPCEVRPVDSKKASTER